jgi:hypothetical protein
MQPPRDQETQDQEAKALMTSVRQTADPKNVSFIRNAIPPLRNGTYQLTATQAIPGQEPGRFEATATFTVAGERFTIRPAEIDSVFPPSLANGEFAGRLAHVILSRCTLPWERLIAAPDSEHRHPDAPWLAVLVCDAAEAPELIEVTAKDLAPYWMTIHMRGSTRTATGTLPDTTLSYGTLLRELDYGETPDDPCTVIDLPAAMFSQLAPAAADLPYLAHIREVDTTEGADSPSTSERHAVVLASRVPAREGATRAYLVSLEGMADYLPQPDGTPSPAIGPSVDLVRLIAYHSWTFTVNDMNETLEELLRGLNADTGTGRPVTTLMLPITGGAPSGEQVARAMAHQADGALDGDDAPILMQNALLMGYLPADHHLRHGGHTVSFYRGPFVPLAVPAAPAALYSGPDAANAYNPQTGLFDVSYGAAWQLGQLLMLQSSGIANQLYQWKREVTRHEAIAAEEALLTRRLAGTVVFPTFLAALAAVASAPPPPLPDQVVSWFGDLAVLYGVPFSYLVPDERMLPQESVRFFRVDQNWIDALIDGAFSIGRATASGQSLEARHAPMVRQVARSAAGRRRASQLAASGATSAPASTTPVSGFLLRSQAVAGWPNLRVDGYSATGSVDAVRITRLSDDTLLGLFNGVVAAMYLREPPEQLQHGVLGPSGGYYLRLRSVNGGPGDIPPGREYPESMHPDTAVPMRANGRTIRVRDAATAIASRLTADFGQTFPHDFTAAELALEMARGVVEVEFRQ